MLRDCRSWWRSESAASDPASEQRSQSVYPVIDGGEPQHVPEQGVIAGRHRLCRARLDARDRVPIEGRNSAPRLGGVDEDNLTAYAHFGDRLRVTATAEFAGYDKSHKPADFARMLGVIRQLFPQVANYEKPFYWAGLRPMTPERTPIFGRGRYRNVAFNTGHGHIGWTMSCGSGRIAADLVAGKAPAIPLDVMLVA